ncbi:MAG: hypothetical protein V4537_08210 [Pseudomonadota bacterium]
MKLRLTIILPIVAGIATLLAVPWLLPGARELRGVDARAQPDVAATPLSTVPTRAVVPTPSPTPSRPPLPSLSAMIGTASAPALAAETARLAAQGAKLSTLGVAYDLVAAKRPAVALSYLEARPDGRSAATWRLRFDLARATGDVAGAAALLSAPPRGTPPTDVIAAGYAIDRPDLIVRAAASGVIPPPDAALTLDLARRLERGGQQASLAALDGVSRSDWRAADPWLALRIANRTGDKAAALRAASLLPATDRAAAEQAILMRSGDRAGLIAMLRRQSVQPGADRAAVAERLLAAGDRAGAIATLQAAAATLPVGAPAAQRLLYLMGPRPEKPDVAWLRRRAVSGPPQGRAEWLLAYADRDAPRDALDSLARHPLAGRTDILLTRLRLARAADDDRAAAAAAGQLLDGRALSSGDLRRIAALVPQDLPPALAAGLARRRADAGLVAPQERLDLAWQAWNRGDATGAASVLRTYLADRPDDVAALRLMAEVQGKLGGVAAARPWFERALVRTPPGRDRVELLERLGRRAEATRLVADLRAAAPADRGLAALHARLLIAQGEPGKARTVLAQ